MHLPAADAALLNQERAERVFLHAMRHLRLYSSFGALIVGGWLGTELAPQQPVSAALAGGYLLWAHYWGMPPVWRWWRRQLPLVLAGCGVSGCPLVFAVAIALFFACAYCYSVFGGGLYQCLKYVYSTRRTRAPL